MKKQSIRSVMAALILSCAFQSLNAHAADMPVDLPDFLVAPITKANVDPTELKPLKVKIVERGDLSFMGGAIEGDPAGYWMSVDTKANAMGLGRYSDKGRQGIWSRRLGVGTYEIGRMENDLRHGRWHVFHADDLEIGHYGKGDRIGTWHKYIEDGSVIETTWVVGKEEGHLTLSSQEVTRRGLGKYIRRVTGEGISAKISCGLEKNNTPVGVWNVIYEDGSSTIGSMKEGLADEIWMTFLAPIDDSKIFLLRVENLNRGNRHGTSWFIDPSWCVKRTEFRNDVPQGMTEGAYKDGHYDQGPIVKGNRHGNWLFQHTDGRWFVENYENGRQSGAPDFFAN
jgi:hypothetical protein